MRIGVVSDTHGHVEYARQAVRMLDQLDVEQVLHCGDIGSADVVQLFGSWPTHFVFGNVDYEEDALRREIEAAGQTCHGAFGAIELAGKKIALLHGHDFARFGETVSDGQYDLVCYGHTHVAKQEIIEGTLVLNPGALYRANPHSSAVVELPQLTATHITL